ncbi:mitochondrial pyruvate carrier [Blastocladiella britannica]|nr:mitochondrial pyruvate carrier [Blastocladiella britannica]
MAASGYAASFAQFLNHPAGPKTIHFWAPAAKWALVIAGLSDINRPVEKISATQTTALAATGVIWSRYATQIVPLNYNLMSVNIFVAGTNLYQLYRIAQHRRSQPATPAASA